MQMAFFYVVDQYLCARLQNDMSPHQIWYYEKNQNPVYVPTHEILLGLYYATKPNKIKKNTEFGTFEEMEQAYNLGKIEFDDIVFCDDKQTTYGRSKVEKILGDMDLSAVLDNPEKGEVMVPISSGNIGKIIANIGAKRDRATIVKNLNTFASQIITHQGMSTPPFEKIFDFNDPELKKIMDSHEPSSIKYTKLNNYIQKIVLDQLKSLPQISDMLKGSGRVKPEQLTEIYAPPIYGNGDVDLSSSNLFEGLTERDFVSKGIENRQVQQIKSYSVPIGGYSSRQLVLSQLNIKFVNEEKSPDRVGLRIPRREAVGRTTLDGRKIRSFSPINANDLVTVKSCINHDDNLVYADEIDQDHLHEKGGAAIGISFAMSFTESKTQGALALKHGGIIRQYEDSIITALHSGYVDDIGDFIVIRTSDGKFDKYLTSGLISLASGITIGSYVKAGAEIAQSRRIKQLHDSLADFMALLGLQNAQADIGMGRESGRGMVVCYAPHDGTITYPTPNVIKIDSLEIPVNRNEMYFYPEGYKIKKDERFCSGLIDLQYFYNLNKTKQDTFDALKKQLYEIEKGYVLGDSPWSNDTRSEVLEVLFRSLFDFKFKARVKYQSTDNFIDRMYYGDNKRGLESFFKKAPNNVIDIEDSIILPLVLGMEPEK